MVKIPKFRGEQSSILDGKQIKICYVMSAYGICTIWFEWWSSRPWRWSIYVILGIMTFKISSSPAMALLFQTSGFEHRFIYFSHSWPSCDRSTNWRGSQYDHPANLLDCALTWEFVELILVPALSKFLLVRLFPSSFHICIPAPEILFLTLLCLFSLELLEGLVFCCCCGFGLIQKQYTEPWKEISFRN